MSKFSALAAAIAWLAMVPVASASLAPPFSDGKSSARDAVDEIRQSFVLRPGERVEIGAIRGDVTIETVNTNRAEIHIVRSARSQDELRNYKVGVGHDVGVLAITGETRQGDRRSGFGPDVRHDVRLKLPAATNLRISSISGSVRIGDVAGPLVVRSIGGVFEARTVGRRIEVEGIAGKVAIREARAGGTFRSLGGGLLVSRANGPMEISGSAGGVTLGQISRGATIRSVGGPVRLERVRGAIEIESCSGGVYAMIEPGPGDPVHLHSVGGPVQLLFRGEVNAELAADGIGGPITLALKKFATRSRSPSTLHATLGRGGRPIILNSISGAVSLLPSR